MKKSLIAVAALATSSVVMAQSSVTLYGVVDAGIGKIKSGGGAGKAQMVSGELMNTSDNKLGFRGARDLGGGLQAGFNFETALSLKDGSASDPFWAGKANVWVGGNWGSLKLGREDTPSHVGIQAWELTDEANYSVVNNTFNNLDGTAGDAGANSQFIYTTPEFGGVSAQLGYVFKDDRSGQAKWAMNVIYAGGPVTASVVANKARGQKLGYAVGGKYDFGGLAVVASYSDNHALRRGFSLGGRLQLGLASLALDVTRDTRNRISGRKYTNGVLEGRYALSKRTLLYAAFLRLDGGNNYGVGVRHNF